jgi:hypothetical protein
MLCQETEARAKRVADSFLQTAFGLVNLTSPS